MNDKTDMKQEKQIWLEMLYASCLCMGLLFLINAWFPFPFPPGVVIPSALFFQLSIRFSEEKGLRIPFWGGLLLLTALTSFILYRKHFDMSFCLLTIRAGILAAALSALCYMASNRLWLKAPLFLLLFLGLVFTGIREVSLPRWAVYFILCGFLLFLSEITAAFSGKMNGGRAILYLTPCFFAAMLLLMPLPIRNTPIRWSAVKEAARYIQEKISTMIVDVRYMLSGENDAWSLSFSGYDSDGGIGGNVFLSEKPQVSITGAQTRSPLYLAGNMHDYYTGSGWENHAAEKPYKEKESLLSCQQFLSALQQSFSETELTELTRSCTYFVTYNGLKTESLFSAPFTQRVILPEKASATASGDLLRLSGPKGPGFTYQLQFTEINLASEKVKEFLRNEKEAVSSDGLPLRERELFIHDNYTLLPDTLPERVKKLADKLTENASTNYDRLKAIETWLSRNYIYTTKPEAPPDGADVVDFFLFESGKGYCTHFASSMAVLARCVGIPTRYVEGFATTSTCSYQNRTLHLTGGNAHAWAEAYLDGIGWIPLEPTPGYFDPANTGWTSSQKVAAGAADTAGRPDLPEAETAQPLSIPDRGTLDKASAFIINNGKALLLLLLELSGLTAVLAVLFAAVIVLRRFLRRRAYHSMNSQDKLRYRMKQALSYGKLYGFPMREDDTLSSYGSRIGSCLNTAETDFSLICQQYQKIRFGAAAASEPDIRYLEHYIRLLRKKYMVSCGFFKRLLFLFSSLY